MGDARILITGSRTWTDEKAVREAINQAVSEFPGRRAVVIHGACPRGADVMAERASHRLSLPSEAHPAEWRVHGRGAGFIRNQLMVDLGADICLAFIRDRSRGASHTARIAEAAGIPVRRFTA
ncbi:SLOG family protein [Streptomyces niveus]|uniref:SLOG family protein n=1 Tax=Streptomyces niveus TaxID=193462 RepID=UPI0036513F79